MPTIPKQAKLTASGSDVLNSVRNVATASYKEMVPIATSANIREIGAVMMEPGHEYLQNEFISTLVNRIGRVIITAKSYSNPWAIFKKGMLEYGETTEEIFTELAKAFSFDPETSETNVEKRVIPDVRTAFHPMNYQKFYKVTVSRDQLKQAFLSENGVIQLVTNITESMVSAANYDEFNVMKYLVGRNILDGNLTAIEVSESSAANMKSIISVIKGVSNNMEFMSMNYNKAGVHNYTTKENQFLIVNSKFDATMDVEVLAAAFNMDKAEFAGHRVLVDGFGSLDDARLDQLFAGSPGYTKITDEEKKQLEEIPAVLCDRDWFMIYDNLIEMTERQNQEGLYWNYWLHNWKTFSVSPFANAVLFVPGKPGVTNVDVTPAQLTITAGQETQLTAKVTTTNFASQEVTWRSGDETKATVDAKGHVTTKPEASETVEIIATSVADKDKSGKCTITFSS